MCIPYLLAIVQDRPEDVSEQFKVHHKVQQVYREVEVVPAQPHEAETTVEDVIEDPLQNSSNEV